MKTWTRSEIEVMAAEGDSICLRCGSRNYGTGMNFPECAKSVERWLWCRLRMSGRLRR